MPERNLATWNVMVGGLIQFEFNEEGMCLFGKMHGMGLFPDKFTLGSVLRGCVGSKEVKLGAADTWWVGLKTDAREELWIGLIDEVGWIKAG
ncbi:hypothetical protein IFM89_017293 [Coptis chinensis]|uniref:Pentatricopeptide repeat-containing protein n=1 Tax=Coptis chinensis TaxID=261450 RepID=A0A835H934_9MAGN|nr:hypothetical protein IFM89_017293 [Coptis chinensis]